MAAIAAYVERFVCKRPIGYFLTCSLVDCVFHLKHEQAEPSTFAEQTDLQELFKMVKEVLETLAMSIGCAQRALDALRCVLVMSSDWDFGVELNVPSTPAACTYQHTGLPQSQGSSVCRQLFGWKSHRNNGFLGPITHIKSQEKAQDLRQRGGLHILFD